LSPIQPVLRRLSAEIAQTTARLGRRVDVAKLGITDRTGELALGPAGGLVSPNGACRMFRAEDGWMALNLARDEDRELVPAWLGCDHGGEAWDLVAAHARTRSCAALVEMAGLLGLPACQVGEVAQGGLEAPCVTSPAYGQAPPRPVPRVLELAALWAGPLCGAVLSAMGCEVTKVESLGRPDPTRASTPGFYGRLNGGKAELGLDLAAPDGRARLLALVMEADVVITSARLRGLASIGLDPDAILRARPGLTWVAITGYGLAGYPSGEHPWRMRVAFGDDAAAAGGLVAWRPDGEPGFAGDALSDPVTGLGAALGALRGLERGGGCLVDAGMAPCAAGAAEACRAQAAP
jgi:hypothetical protein